MKSYVTRYVCTAIINIKCSNLKSTRIDQNNVVFIWIFIRNINIMDVSQNMRQQIYNPFFKQIKTWIEKRDNYNEQVVDGHVFLVPRDIDITGLNSVFSMSKINFSIDNNKL